MGFRVDVVAIIQARMNSSRLPGKVLQDVAGRTMLARVVRRVRRATRIDRVVVATTCGAKDDAIVDECCRLGVAWFRASATDVLSRYYYAARAFRAKTIVRITSDCPLIDPGLIDQVVGEFQAVRPDYASNCLQRTWPRGMDTEIMSSAALARAWREADLPYERTHVTPYIYMPPRRFRLHSVRGPEDHSDLRLTVDTPDDLALIRAIHASLNRDDDFTWREAVELLAAEPWLRELNKHSRQKDLVEG